MTKNILILEDDSVQLEMLKNSIENNYEDVMVSGAETASLALTMLKKDIHYDVFMLDISLGADDVDQQGIDFARKIREVKDYLKTPIIFITGHPKFVFDAVNEAHCYSYVIKPYDEKDIISQLNEVFFGDTMITVRTTNKVYINLDINDIYYIESMGRYQYFHTVHNDDIKTREHNFKYYEELLSGGFIRCHKSYIVNKNYIGSVSIVDRIIKIKGTGEEIPFTVDAKGLVGRE